MNKLKPIHLKLEHKLNTFLLTITYSTGNNYTAKTFSFKSKMLLFQEYNAIINKFPYLISETTNEQ